MVPGPMVEKTEYTCILSEEEAQTLMAILGKVGGNPEKSRRRWAHSMRSGLRDAGIYSVMPAPDLTGEGMSFRDLREVSETLSKSLGSEPYSLVHPQ